MKKKRYTKPVVIDLGKQTLHTIENGLLSWNRNGASAENAESCEEDAAITADCKADDQKVMCCDIKKDSDKRYLFSYIDDSSKVKGCRNPTHLICIYLSKKYQLVKE